MSSQTSKSGAPTSKVNSLVSQMVQQASLWLTKICVHMRVCVCVGGGVSCGIPIKVYCSPFILSMYYEDGFATKKNFKVSQSSIWWHKHSHTESYIKMKTCMYVGLIQCKGKHYLLLCLSWFRSSYVLLGSKHPNTNSHTDPLIAGWTP